MNLVKRKSEINLPESHFEKQLQRRVNRRDLEDLTEKVLLKVSDIFSVPPNFFTLNRSDEDITYPRKLAVYFIVSYTRIPITLLSDIIGRSRATLYYYLTNFENTLTVSPERERADKYLTSILNHIYPENTKSFDNL